MAATTRPSPEPSAPAPSLSGGGPVAGRCAPDLPEDRCTPDHARSDRALRFDLTERLVHWTTAVAVLVLAVTGALLYVPSLGAAVGRRLLVEDWHVYAGLAVLVPVVVGSVGRQGAQLRNDLRQMANLTTAEMDWLRTLGRRGWQAIGKFNPGQKLNTNAMGGLLVVLFGTGTVMRWGNFLPVTARTGATFVHDVAALVLGLLVVGHVVFALSHPHALRSMVTGWVPRWWPGRHAPSWQVGDQAPEGPGPRAQ